MIRERRTIEMTVADLVNAIKSYRRVNKDFLPEGDITACEIQKDGALRIAVRMAYGKTKQSAVFDIEKEEVVTIIVRACCEVNIPIPKNGVKQVAPSKYGVAMRITLDTPTQAADHDVALAGEAKSAEKSPGKSSAAALKAALEASEKNPKAKPPAAAAPKQSRPKAPKPAQAATAAE